MSASVRQELFEIIYNVGPNEAVVMLELPEDIRNRILDARRLDNVARREAFEQQQPARS